METNPWAPTTNIKSIPQPLQALQKGNIFMPKKDRSRAEILENLKHFGNAKVKKLGLYGDECLYIEGSEILDSVNCLQVTGFGNARLKFSDWAGALELYGSLEAEINNVDTVDIDTTEGYPVTCTDCRSVRVIGRATATIKACKAVVLFDSSSAELMACNWAEAYDSAKSRALEDSCVVLFNRADGDFFDNSVGVLFDSSRATVYKDAKVNAVSDLSSVLYEAGATVFGDGKAKCFGSDEDNGSLFTATRAFLNSVTRPLDAFETEYLVYKTTGVDGLTGRLYGEPTEWVVGGTVSISKEKRTDLNHGLFFTPTLGHAVSRGREYSHPFRVFKVRIRLADVKVTNMYMLQAREEIEVWEGEVLDEIKNPVEELFRMR